jgi:predicted transcriptional regulator
MLKPLPENCAPFLKALADKTRWGIVQKLLVGRAMNVNELATQLEISEYNASKHLRILREVGIVATKRKGKNIECTIVPEYRRRVAKDNNQLDLGCCVFSFDKKCC